MDADKPFPQDFWERLVSLPATLDQTTFPLELDRDQVEQFFLPLAVCILEQLSPEDRFMVGIAGPPGSGKTAFAHILAAVIWALSPLAEPIVIGLDGWHFSNAFLDAHAINWQGTTIPLRTIKGAPETFDVSSALQCAHIIRAGKEVAFPVYSRLVHDSISASGWVRNEQRLVIWEGNYLLLAEPRWNLFRSLFDLTIFIRASSEIIVSSLVKRHMRGGKSERVARQQVERVDLPNARRVLAGFRGADWVVTKIDDRRIQRMERGVHVAGSAGFILNDSAQVE